MALSLRLTALVFPAVLVLACSPGQDGDDGGRALSAGAGSDAMGTGVEELTAADVERGRHDPAWRAFAERDRAERTAARTGGTAAGASGAPGGGERAESGTGGTAGDPASGEAEGRDGSARSPADTATGESWDDIGAGSLDVDPAALPLEGEAEGPSVLAVQVLLDRARFSPGVADGYWGKNTEKAVYWLQSERGMEATGVVDRATLDMLRGEAGSDGELTTRIRLTDALVSGPFVSIPEGIYERAEMECLCYESLGEKLAERFHTTREVLSALNPGLELDALSAGEELVVPDHGAPADSLTARDAGRDGTPVARIVVSDGGHYLHALAADGSILYHFPSTLGSDYAPSPTGDYAVNSIARDPTWHYQPELLTGEDPSRDDAIIPPGPNNPVGVVWIDLTKPHYGIHGTAAPSTIGYATSHGCVRLTNWDAAFLADRPGVESGTPVQFRDGSGREG
ncbi:MAG: L,D-transpeptidase family protein, partial [Gemmatimonadetes bacterium]|nr:L,D-transpeptidase family protein [Gemmatimonadota bacterium]